MTATLETKLRELAARGEITHLSLVPRGSKWEATFAPASTFGITIVQHADPVTALTAALENTKLKRRSTAGLKPTSEPEPVSAADDAYDPAA